MGAVMKEKPHILVVEDKAEFSDPLKAALEAKGFEVTVVTSGEEALEKLGLKAADYDIELDPELPGNLSDFQAITLDGNLAGELGGIEIAGMLEIAVVFEKSINSSSIPPILFASSDSLQEDAKMINGNIKKADGEPFMVEDTPLKVGDKQGKVDWMKNWLK